MDAGAFGLSRDPFQRSSELDDACVPNTIAALLSELQSGLRSPQGLSVLVGAPSSGKSIAAAAFARRVASAAHTALLARPTSSVSAIARDALAKLGAADGGPTHDDHVTALRASVLRRRATGRPTVLVVDDAERLSPQALEDLAQLFADDDRGGLHVFLFGRPRLLDRMHAGAEKALHAHLLQICRIPSLGVRECVRYLERRLAICGGELGALFGDEAIDELVQRAEGRIVRLEELASEALQRAAARKAAKVAAEDVISIPAKKDAEEEEEPMATRQQPLQFELDDDDAIDGEEWEAGDEEDGDGEEWEAEEDGDGEEWEAEEEDELEEEEDGLDWDPSPSRKELELPAVGAILGPVAAKRSGASKQAAAAGRGIAGRAVLSLVACLGLVWAANQLPGDAADARHGRDSKLFAGGIASEPKQILRLARSAAEADADAHVVAWREQPAKPVQVASRADVDESATAGSASRATSGQPSLRPAMATAGDFPTVDMPAERRAVESPREARREASTNEKASGKPIAKKPATEPRKAPTPAKAPTAAKSAKPASAPGAVYTVQLGAFKTRQNAEDLATRLRGKPTKIVREGGLYRVMSGKFSSKKDATLHEASLRRAGYNTFVRTAVF